MANKGFQIIGDKELKNELMSLGRNMTKIITPGMKKGAAAIESVMERNAPVDQGDLRKNIKTKVFKNTKNVVARVGILNVNATNSKGEPVAKYAGVQEAEQEYMEKSVRQSRDRAKTQMLNMTQQKLNAFHAAQPKAKPRP